MGTLHGLLNRSIGEAEVVAIRDAIRVSQLTSFTSMKVNSADNSQQSMKFEMYHH